MPSKPYPGAYIRIDILLTKLDPYCLFYNDAGQQNT